jgi:hypothetical protein
LIERFINQTCNRIQLTEASTDHNVVTCVDE